MLATSESTAKIDGSRPPRWNTWLPDSGDADVARSVLDEQSPQRYA